ncbi:MAG: Uma2 family endonuclease [Gloeocapsa sp. DLM2.Bin57]|nr:MAG: Uma2 family endonuclease [Gloeocapsa sp. DLM2.Bin57]
MFANSRFISEEEYLLQESISQVKHEYRQGIIYAMAGASNNHVLIALNIASLLKNHLRGTGCRTYISDTKVKIESLNTYYYPDVIVSCDESDRSLANFLLYPCLIIEILSETTEAFDRGDKFADYRQLESLQEYVLISQKQPCLESFRRNSQNQWLLSVYGSGDRVRLETVKFDCLLNDIYEDIQF